MHRFVRRIARQLGNYSHMMKLKKIYSTPHEILYSPALSLLRKKELLTRWCEDRMRYIFEYGRDHDYQQDAEMNEILKTVEIIKAADSLQTKIKINLNIYVEDDSENIPE